MNLIFWHLETMVGKSAESFYVLQPVKDRVLTITSDNGKEFAYHKKISENLNAKVYFAHPYHSWERGLCENTNPPAGGDNISIKRCLLLTFLIMTLKL